MCCNRSGFPGRHEQRESPFRRHSPGNGRADRHGQGAGRGDKVYRPGILRSHGLHGNGRVGCPTDDLRHGRRNQSGPRFRRGFGPGIRYCHRQPDCLWPHRRRHSALCGCSGRSGHQVQYQRQHHGRDLQTVCQCCRCAGLQHRGRSCCNWSDGERRRKGEYQWYRAEKYLQRAAGGRHAYQRGLWRI